MDPAILRQTAIFEDLDDAEIQQVADICHEQTYATGDHIFKEGEPGNRLFLILDGRVRISRDIPGSGEEALSVLQPGACFGEMAVFDRTARSTDAIADVTCRLATITRPEFEMLLEFNRDLAYKVLWAMVRLLSTRLRATNESLRAFLAMSMF
jgi:CRP-like cAMP-binding protein